MQHGFNRSKENLGDLATHFMNNGLMVLTVDYNVTGGNARLAREVADDLMEHPPVPPVGFALPGNLVLFGHSAGGLFVSYMGGRLASRNYSALKGVILLDIVDKDNGMAPNLQAVVDCKRPVLAIMANSSSCNSSNNALRPLRNLSDPFVGIKLTDNSKHSDAEGSSTGGIFVWLCGSPIAQNVAYLKDFTFNWAKDMVKGTSTVVYYPGGAKIQSLINSNDGVLIKQMTTNLCGNGIVEMGEECDGGDCCDIDCNFISRGIQCRAANGKCDVEETCSGSNAYCPEDSYEEDGTVCSAGVCHDGICTTEDNVLPDVNFTYSTSELTVYFTDDSSDTDGFIEHYSWDFGDGETSAEMNPTHTYSAEGTYSVTLTVTDDDGGIDSVTKNVTFGKMQCGASPISGSNSPSVNNVSIITKAFMVIAQ